MFRDLGINHNIILVCEYELLPRGERCLDVSPKIQPTSAKIRHIPTLLILVFFLVIFLF